MTRLTEQEQAEQDAVKARRDAVEASAKPRPKGRANRADRRSWGIRGRAPLGGAFRRPVTRPSPGIDPAAVQRPSTRLHGRGRHGVT